MVTPIMITNIDWGTYLFFAIVNACFIPVIYFFYPETARRSLEEIDIIFAKGFVENKSYVRAAEELPLLTPEQVEQEALKYGLIDTAARGAAHARGHTDVVAEKALSEKSEIEAGSHEELEN